MPIKHPLLRHELLHTLLVLLLIVKCRLLQNVLVVGLLVLEEGQVALGDLLEDGEAVQ